MPSALLRLRSDEQLVALFRAGNDDAFRMIHDRYRARLFAYTRQMLAGSRSDAEDALQDVFLRAYHALRQDERPVILKAWLYRVAHNRCIDQIRRPTPPANEIFEVSRTPLPDPLEQAERREDLRRLVQDVQRLPEQQRSALLMREMEGLSYAELAQALDTSVPAVKSLLVRARIGLVEAAEARNTSCTEIRDDLALSFGKGVRSSAKARKHMRECASCRAYRTELKAVSTGLSSLTPAGHPLLGLFAKLASIGGAGGGAAAGGSAAAGGGAAVVGGGVVAGTTAKVAAVVCCAAVVGGGAVEIKKHAPQSSGTAPAAKHAAAGDGAARTARAAAPGVTATDTAKAIAPARLDRTGAAARGAAAAGSAGKAAKRRGKAKAVARVAPLPSGDAVISPHVAEAETPTLGAVGAGVADAATGGAMAPSEAGSAAGASESSTSSAAAPGTSASGPQTIAGATSGSGTGSAAVGTGQAVAAIPPAGGAGSSTAATGTAGAGQSSSATQGSGPAATAASQYPTQQP